MMELSIACPLCSQPGFPDVNSLWLTLIRVTTRQLACPVCQEVLCGLDKLTIHLVSHSLHDHLLQACVASNFQSPAASFTKSSNLPNTVSISPQETVNVTNNENASYILINLPSGENASVLNKSQDHVAGFLKENVSDNEKSVLALPSLAKFAGLASCKTEKSLVSNLTSLSIPPHTPNNEKGHVKFITEHQHIGNECRMSCASSHSEQDQSSCREGTAMWHSSSSSEKELQIPSNCSENCSSEFSHAHSLNYESKSVREKMGEAFAVGDNMENFSLETLGLPVKCGLCDLTFKDDHIAVLHQQFVHNIKPQDCTKDWMALKSDDTSKPCKSKRVTTASQSRDGAGPLHRFPCHVCNKVFRMRGSLMIHLRAAHTSVGTVGLASRLCGSNNSAKALLSGEISTLPMQNLTIQESKATLASDMLKSKHFEGRRVDQKIFDQTRSVNALSSSIPKSENEQVCTDSNHLPGSDPSSNQSPMSPSISPTLSPTAQELTGMTFPCYLCNKTFSKEALLTQHSKSHDSKQWECDVCFKSFTTKYFLKKHKRLHTGEMPYTCGICNKSFTFQQSYHKHLLYHSDEKPHSCNECGRAFKELSTLHNHQRIHTGEKPWACETCGKCFRQRVSYLVHRRIHTGAMPYQCAVCLKSFRYKVSQRTHKCLAVPSAEVNAQPADLLQQLMLSTSKEVNLQSVCIEPSPASSTLFEEPQMHFENHLKRISAKQNDVQQFAMEVPHTENPRNHIIMKNNSTDSQVIPEELHVGHRIPHLQHQSNETHLQCSSSQSIHFEVHSPINELVSEGTLSSDHKACSVFDFSSAPQEPHESKNLHNASTILPQPPPSTSSADFNIDLLQDILSMVMSPSSESTPSPSAQMRHLSLTGQSEDDIESGLELRQLLYGPCNSESSS